MKVSKERFNQDLVGIENKKLYCYGNYYTNGSMIVDKRCVTIEKCEIKELNERAFNNVIAPIVNDTNLENIAKSKNLIQQCSKISLKDVHLYQTTSKYILVHKDYHNIFTECEPLYYKDKFVYCFVNLPKLEEDEENEIMFVGCFLVCEGTQNNVDNLIKMNEFYKNLSWTSNKEKRATEFKIKQKFSKK